MGSAVTERVRKHREHLRAEGLKPVQIWVPDTRSDAFRRKCASRRSTGNRHPRLD